MVTLYKIFVLFLGLVIFVLMATSANAYELPPYKGVELKVIGDITGNYSNNLTYASDNENRIEDYRTMLNLGLDFQYNSIWV